MAPGKKAVQFNKLDAGKALGAAVPGQDAHPHSKPRHLRPYPAKANDSERLARELDALSPEPCAPPHLPIHMGKAFCRRPHESYGHFSNGRVAIALYGMYGDCKGRQLLRVHIGA